jgi:FAD binding domain/Berberine and berberine like
VAVGAEKGIDRRDFLVRAGAGGLSLATGAAVAGCGSSGGTTTKVVEAALRRRKRVAAPIPRTFQAAMRGHVFNRGDPGFLSVAHIYNERFDGILPKAVGRPLGVRDVQGAVRWAIGHGVQMRARSGGHSYAGYSTLANGVVLDLSKMRSISVNKRAKTATVGAGAQLIDIYAGLASQGATIPAGSCPSVGVSGVTLGGGMGLAARAFGLTIDNLVGVQIVTADGTIRTVNRNTDPDLLWALRGGGGGNFGIVTQFMFNIHPVPRAVTYFSVSWPWSSASEAIATWQSWAPRSNSQLTSIFHINAAGSPSVTANGQLMGNANGLRGLIGPLLGVPGAQLSTFTTSNYLSMQLLLAGCSGHSLTYCHTEGTRSGGQLQRASFQAKSDYVAKPINAAGRHVLISAAEARSRQPGSGAILFDSYGGAINRVAPTATAFVHRNQMFAVQYLSYNGGGAWLGQTWQAMRPYVSGQAYQNYVDASLPNWQQAYYAQNYARLKATRKRVDPDWFFKFPQAIGH